MTDKILTAIFNHSEPFYSEFKNIITYNSSKIEGSTLSLNDNKSLMNNSCAVRDSLCKNHKLKFVVENQHLLDVFEYVVNTYKQPLTHNYVKSLHKKLTFESPDIAERNELSGDYRNNDIRIGGAPGARPQYIHKLMDALIKKFAKKSMTIEDIAYFHAEYEIIHPFYDGNGRAGRMIAFKQCLQYGHTPFIVTNENKMEYYDALNIARDSANYDYLTKYFISSQNVTTELFKKTK